VLVAADALAADTRSAADATIAASAIDEPMRRITLTLPDRLTVHAKPMGLSLLTVMPAPREPVHAPDAPAAIGPYSHAVRHGEVLYCSGQIPLDPESGELVCVSAGAQARRCLENLAAVCDAAGTTLSRAVRLTIYMVELSGFVEVNEVCAEFFADSPPARTTIGVAALPRGAAVEIDAIVAL
jgi:2-iminobutanoate/2-iminopropanoate deaminase